MNRRDFLARLPRTWPVRLALALVLLSLLCVAVLALWYGRDLLAIATILVIAYFGLGAVVAILPLTDSWRARMAAHGELSERYPSYRYKGLFWLGLGVLAGQLWGAYPSPVALEDLLASVIFLVPGLIATLVWRFRDRGLARRA